MVRSDYGVSSVEPMNKAPKVKKLSGLCCRCWPLAIGCSELMTSTRNLEPAPRNSHCYTLLRFLEFHGKMPHDRQFFRYDITSGYAFSTVIHIFESGGYVVHMIVGIDTAGYCKT